MKMRILVRSAEEHVPKNMKTQYERETNVTKHLTYIKISQNEI
jgi:hypothetical protein